MCCYMKMIPTNTTSDGCAFAIKASYFKNCSLTTLTGGGGHYPCTGVLVVESGDTGALFPDIAARRQGVQY